MFYLKVWGAVLIIICVIVTRTSAGPVNLDKRSIAPSHNLESAAEASSQLQNNYDEYPMVVPKRAAMLLDRLMVALHHALEDENNGSRRINEIYGSRKSHVTPTRYPVGVGIKPEMPGIRNFNNQLTDDYDIYSEMPTEVDGRETKFENSQDDSNRSPNPVGKSKWITRLNKHNAVFDNKADYEMVFELKTMLVILH